jgi:glyoxylase-like metal-dependent hydrolase (beta-lactamase superfamily II)
VTETLIHEILPVGWLQCNCSVIGDPQTRDAIVLDPGDEVERIQEILARHKLTVRAIVNTHAHIDHVGGLCKLHDATGAPVLMHGDDLELYRALETQAAWIGMPAPEIADVDGLLREGDEVRWGRYAARVLHTPGHTPGSLCLHMPADDANAHAAAGKGTAAGAGILLAGDTLFAGSIGRTDLWGGSFEEIMRSLQIKLMALPDDTHVFPGHGPSTTIGRERESNPFLRAPFLRT